jgi:uncharacterized RDD family membrane protein YckC
MSSAETADPLDLNPEPKDDMPPDEVLTGRSRIERVYLRRFFALLIDFAILSALGSLCVWVGLDQLLAMGDWAFPLGLGILVAYFIAIPLMSKHAATPGMSAMGLNIVNGDMNRPSARKLILRYTLLILILYFNEFSNWTISGNVPRWDFMPVLLLPAGLLWIGNQYLALFNRSNGQYFHDALFDVHVVVGEPPGEYQFRKLWGGHIVAVVLIVLLIPIVSVSHLMYSMASGASGDQEYDYNIKEDQVESVFYDVENIKYIWVHTDPEPEEHKFLYTITVPAGSPSIDVNLDLRRRRTPSEMKPLIDDVAETTLSAFSDTPVFETLKISWDYEVPFLIRTVYTRNSIEMPIQEWRTYMRNKGERTLESLPLEETNNFESGLAMMFLPGG